jgi:hypothetical protein
MNDKPNKVVAPKSSHKKRVFFGVAVAALVAGAIWIDLQPVFQYRAIKSRVKDLVPLGSDIDSAGEILTDAGFQFYGKHFADVGKDSYSVDIKIHYKRRSVVADALGHLHIYLYYNYVVIEAGLDNKVRRIF